MRAAKIHRVLFWLAAVSVAAIVAQSSVSATGEHFRHANRANTLVTLNPTSDTYVNQNSPDTAYAADSALYVSRDEFLQERYALMRFSLAAIPAGSTITSATLYLYQRGTDIGTPSLRVLQVTSNWTSGTATWNNRPSLALFVYAAQNVPPAPPGGAWIAWPVTSLVNCWVNNPGVCPNYGLAVRGPSASSFLRYFDSLQGVHDPYLDIDYTAPTATPTATSTSTRTPTVTQSPTASQTLPPGVTPSNTPTPTITATPTRTGTPTGTATNSPTATNTPLPGTIGDRVWRDDDLDGVEDAGEPGLAGVSLYLLRNHVLIDTQVTDANGHYAFDGLDPAAYTIDVDIWTVPPGYWVTNGSEPRVAVLNGGEDVLNVDFGYAPSPTATPQAETNADLNFAGWDTVQVADGAPLVADKPTIVRVYVGATGADGPVPNVRGRLLRVGVDTWDTALRSDNAIVVDPAEDPYLDNRDDIDGALYFRLPDDWRQGSYWANVWINYDGDVNECGVCADNNVGSRFVSFVQTDPLDLYVIRVTVGISLAASADRFSTTSYLRNTFPIPFVTVLGHPSDGFTANHEYDGEREPGGCAPGWQDLLDDLREIADDTDVTGLSHPKFYGLVPSDLVSPNGACGSRSDPVAAGRSLRAGAMAHEVTHNTGQRHNPSDPDDPNCGDPGRVDENYPDPSGHLVGYGVNLDREPPRIYPAATTYDLMTYCRPKYMSAFTFEGLLNHFTSENAAMSLRYLPGSGSGSYGAALAAGGGYLRVAGQLHGEVVSRLRPFYQVSAEPGGSDQAGSGGYAIKLEDASGQALFTRLFDPTPYEDVHDVEELDAAAMFSPGFPAHPHAGSAPAFFNEVLPLPPGTARIVILHGAAELDSRDVSASAPVVALVAPNGGESWGASGARTISWTASDLDGGPLWHTLQYSTDGGAHWRALAVSITGDHYVVDSAVLAGSSQARIRITTTDGVNTAQATSAAVFSVGEKPPEVAILSPAPGRFAAPGALVELGGMVLDLEDGTLPDGALEWSSDRQGLLGTGLNATTSALAPGWHTLTLTATDSDGQTAEASVMIFVGRRWWVPVVAR